MPEAEPEPHPERAEAAPSVPPPVPETPVGAVDRFDRVVDDWWGRTFRGHPSLDRLFYVASELADFSVLWQLVGLAQGLRDDERDEEAAVRLGVVLMAESALVNQGIKRLFRRRRPEPDEPRPHHLRAPTTSSFPSGHASAAFTAAGLLAQRDPRLRPVIYAAAAVVATSRVHVKVHHPSDVVAGAALGIAFARLARRAWPLPPRR